MLHRDVAEGVHRIGEHYVNWYLIEEGGRITIVDAGLPASWGSLLGALERLGRSTGDVEALVLTHAHFDHIGFAERARAELGVPVWVHENDAPLTRRPWQYMSERSPFAYLSPGTLQIVGSFIKAGAPRVGSIRQVRRFGNEGTLDVPGSPASCSRRGTPWATSPSTSPTATRSSRATPSSRTTPTPTPAAHASSPARRRPTANGRWPRSNSWRAPEPGRSCRATASPGRAAPKVPSRRRGGWASSSLRRGSPRRAIAHRAARRPTKPARCTPDRGERVIHSG